MGYNKQGVQRTAGPQEGALQCALSKSRSSARVRRRGRKALAPRMPEGLLVFSLELFTPQLAAIMQQISPNQQISWASKVTHRIWGIICLCAWFCNQFMNHLYLSTKCQRSADHELSHTAKNLLGAISGVSGEP